MKLCIATAAFVWIEDRTVIEDLSVSQFYLIVVFTGIVKQLCKVYLNMYLCDFTVLWT